MKIINRIFKVIEHKGISASKFEKQNGISTGYLSKMRAQDSYIGEKIIVSILDNNQDLSAEWLMRGEGEMIRIKNDEKTVNITNVHRSNTGSIATGAAAAPSSSSEECAFLREQIKEKDARIKELTDTIVKIALK